MLTDQMSSDGERYAHSMSIIGAMKKCGLSVGEAVDLFDRYANYGRSFNRKSVERMFREFR
jgi:hypothetical protein